MPTGLLLEWDGQIISGLEADYDQKNYEIKQKFSTVFDDNTGEQTESEKRVRRGQTLLSTLQELKIVTKDVVVVLPRDSVVMKHFQVPHVPAEELPDLVRYQVASQTSVPADHLICDFLPLPVPSESGDHIVLTATIPPQTFHNIRSIIETAGLKLQGVRLSPLAIEELTFHVRSSTDQSHSNNSSTCSLIVAPIGNRLEVSWVMGETLLFSHATRSSNQQGFSPDMLIREVTRSTIPFQKTFSTLRTDTIYFLVPEMYSEAERRTCIDNLQERFDVPVHPLSPTEEYPVELAPLPERPASFFYAPFGALLELQDPSIHSMDLLHPRQKPEKVDRRKQLLVAAGILGVLLLGLAYWFRSRNMNRLEEEIVRLKGEQKSLQKELKDYEPLLKSVETLEGWNRSRQSWLNHFSELESLMKGTDQTMFRHIVFQQLSDRSPGKISGEGIAINRQSVEQFNTALAQHPQYTLRPHETTQSDNRKDYPYDFELDLDVNRNEESQAEN